MPRIVPLQLLGCLKVLLDENGGIKSSNDVKRLAGLMTKYSKKLVSKCVYVQILKSTKTELLEEFMSVGGWGLVYTWLNESMRSTNWPLVQELLELLLLCPVDVNRLKINSAPKLVKELCREGGNEHVKILARRLVEQWLKIVTGSSDNLSKSTVKGATTLPRVAVNATEHSHESTDLLAPSDISSGQITTRKIASKLNNPLPEYEKTMDKTTSVDEQDPLADVGLTVESPSSYSLTRAQKKAKEEGLVYKIIVRNGQQVLAKVAKTQSAKTKNLSYNPEHNNMHEEDKNAAEENEIIKSTSSLNSEREGDNSTDAENNDELDNPERSKNNDKTMCDDDLKNKKNKNSLVNKNRKISDSSNSSCDGEEHKSKITSIAKTTLKIEHEKVSAEEIKTNDKKDSLMKSDRKSKDIKERETDRSKTDKYREKYKDKHRKGSSSSSHRLSSSSNKNSSSKGSTSSSKTKSSSTSSHRSSSDKKRHEKARSSSASKEKDKREGSNSSSLSSPALNKHRTSKSSSSKEHHSSSHTSKDREKRDKEKTMIDIGKNSLKKDKERNEKELMKASSEIHKTKDDLNETPDNGGSLKSPSTSFTIPSKKASISIETRRDAEKVAAVKTYKAQFRSHGLTEEAPPPPSRKGLKKPSSSTPPAPGTSIPHSVPLPATLKRPSPPPSSSSTPLEKKPKIDISALSVPPNEKPGAIKLIPAKRIQTLVETNLFSDALSAATGPKKPLKRKRLTTATQGTTSKEASSPPVSPELSKLAPLKFYQDTLDENKIEEKTDKENIENMGNKPSKGETSEENTTTAIILTDDDEDTPLKKVKESIQQRVLQEQKAASDIAKNDTRSIAEVSSEKESSNDTGVVASSENVETTKKPGPGCGPNGPPGVLMLHRRAGPKKKLSWRPPEHLEQIRYFELDENERVNVTKVTFNDMKNMERFSERDAINIARRGFNMDDKMQPQTNWRPLIEVDDVPEHPNGNQSKQRKIQAEREMTTLRALYFSHAMIPDSPAEAELEPHYAHDVPIIPLEDITGNPDAVNDFTSMPWPEPKGSPPRHSEGLLSGSGGLSGLDSTHEMFGGVSGGTSLGNNAGSNSGAFNPFNPFGVSMANMQGHHQKQHIQITSQANGSPGWPGPINPTPITGMGPSPLMGTPFNSGPNHMPNAPSPNINMSMMGVPGPMIDNANPQNFMGGPQMGQFGGPGGPGNYIQNGPQYPQQIFNVPNFGGPLGNSSGGPRQLMNIDPMMNGVHNQSNNNGGKWRNNVKNFHGNNGGGVDNWRPAGPGSMRGDNGRSGRDSSNNNGVCKAFVRGHCRLGRSCKFIHPKSKRL